MIKNLKNPNGHDSDSLETPHIFNFNNINVRNSNKIANSKLLKLQSVIKTL